MCIGIRFTGSLVFWCCCSAQPETKTSQLNKNNYWQVEFSRHWSVGIVRMSLVNVSTNLVGVGV